MSDQGVLFAIPGVRDAKPRASKRPPKPVWSDYRVLNQVKCHRCLDAATLGWNTGAPLGMIPTARHQRKLGTEQLLLCAEHARALKAEDAAAEKAAEALMFKRPHLSRTEAPVAVRR